MGKEIEYRGEKRYKFSIKNDPFFSWDKAIKRKVYYLKPESFNYFFYILAHDYGIKVKELEAKKQIVDYGFFYVTYKLRNDVYIRVFIETKDPYEQNINVSIWLFFYW